MSRRGLESALDSLRLKSPSLAEEAEAAIGWLTGARGLDGLTQYSLQYFLWYELLHKWIVPPDEEDRLFEDVREGLAYVLAAVGLDRYAFICRSPATEEVRAAYRRSDKDYYLAFGRAMVSSGIQPPDLEDFEWGKFMGPQEAAAYDTVALALERAIAAGELKVGGRGWKIQQRRVAAATLDREQRESKGKSLRQLVVAERRQWWSSRARSKDLAALHQRAMSWVRISAEPPEDLALRFEPLLFLLEEIGDGIMLTERGNFSRAFVTATVAKRESWGKYLSGPPRRQDDVPELVVLHGLLKKTRAVVVQKRRMRLTTKGREMLREPSRAWSALVDGLVRSGQPELICLEALGLLLLEMGADESEDILFERVATIFGDEGYRGVSDGARPTSWEARWILADILQEMALLGLIERAGTWDKRRMGLTECGRVTLRKVVSELAIAPRRSLGP